MKTLIVQLARLGDIYQTWPVVRALKRQDPDGEIHFLARRKFAGACEGLESVDRFWHLDSYSVLEPLIANRPDVDESLGRIEGFCEELRGAGFDRIINLSFSPFASHLCFAISPENCVVRGYTRHADGWLAIPDDASAYFYAQVGVGRENRMHVTDVFAQVADVDLIDEDWSPPSSVNGACANRVVLHVGASDARKTYGTHQWQQVVRGLLEAWEGDVVLVGSRDERPIADAIATAVDGSPRILNRVGETNLPELFDLIARSRLLLGCDSGPVHIAALTSTPVLNLSFSAVNFWETGPKSKNSRILMAETSEDLASDHVVGEALAMLTGAPPLHPHVITVPGPLSAYEVSVEMANAPGWKMLQAVYMGGAFPYADHLEFAQGLFRLKEAVELAIGQIRTLRLDPRSQVAASILERTDEIIQVISGLVPELGVLVRWFQTEKIRLGPMPLAELTDQTESLYLRMNDVLDLYLPKDMTEMKGNNQDDDISLG